MKETLKKLRTGNRYSQDLLAKILGISRLSYMKYESGEVEPPVEIIRKLAKIYKVSYETLIDNELKSENLSFSYDFSNNKNHDFAIASSTPAYGASLDKKKSSMSSDMILQFSSILSELQNTIKNMQERLNSVQASESSVSEFNKSEAFNKEAFFSQIDKVQIDSSYIDELRGASLI